MEDFARLLADFFRPGMMLLLHHEPEGRMVIWSDTERVMEFFVERVGW